MPANETFEPCPFLVQKGVANIVVDSYDLSLYVHNYTTAQWPPELVIRLGQNKSWNINSPKGDTDILTKDEEIFLRLFASRIKLVYIDSDVNSNISSANSFHPSNYTIFNLSSSSFEELCLPVGASSTQLIYSPTQADQIKCNGNGCGEEGRPADNGFSQPLIITGVHSRPKGYGEFDASSPSCTWTENQVN